MTDCERTILFDFEHTHSRGTSSVTIFVSCLLVDSNTTLDHNVIYSDLCMLPTHRLQHDLNVNLLWEIGYTSLIRYRLVQ